MDNFNLGGGSSLLGGQSPLQEAIARRANGQGGATAQQSPASAGFNPDLSASIPGSPMPAGGQPGGQPPPAQPGAVPPVSGSPEAELIVRALSQRLKDLTKLGV